MIRQRSALAMLLQERREAAGYSRRAMGELLGIKPGTIEGWELGRVERPPIHDVVRVAHFLNISADSLHHAVLEDTGDVPVADDFPAKPPRTPRAKRTRGRAPLLEAAFLLFEWADESDAADALETTADEVKRWRSGAEPMTLRDHVTLSSMIGIAAAEAMRGDERRTVRLHAAAGVLGLRTEDLPHAGEADHSPSRVHTLS